jgi:hypothetical protein
MVIHASSRRSSSPWTLAAEGKLDLPAGGRAEAGADALLDPARQLTVIEKIGFFFVPPYHEEGLAAAVFTAPRERPRATGRIVARFAGSALSYPQLDFWG